MVENIAFQIHTPHSGCSSIAIRPEHIEVFTLPPQGRPPNLMQGTIAQINNQGVYADVILEVSGVRFQSILTTSSLHASALAPGTRVFMQIAPEHIHFI